MLLLELFDKVSPIVWHHRAEHGNVRVLRGRFRVDAYEFQISIDDYGGNVNVEFVNEETDFDMLNELGVKAMTVFATVLNAVIEYAQEHQPKKIGFTADTEVGLASLYRRLIKRERSRIEDMGYTLSVEEPSRFLTVFTFRKQDDRP